MIFRDAERFVSDDAGRARRAKRRGRGAVTGETAMEVNRFDRGMSIRPSKRASPASFRLRSSPRVVGFRVSAEGPDGLGRIRDKRVIPRAAVFGARENDIMGV